MYFVGVTTAQSSIQRIFPQWTRLAGVDDATLAGFDIALDAPPSRFRQAVTTIRTDTESWGALVTSHKIPIHQHARDLFTNFDADAERLGEVSCIVRRAGSLKGEALDTLTSRLALEAIGGVPRPGAVLIFGAGGAAVALATVLARQHPQARVVLTDISADRLERARRLTSARCVLAGEAAENDRQLRAMPPGSLIVNATGMGKDRPGSPVTPHAVFPGDAVAWDFNYRGNLLFLDYARSQGVRTVDGWEYFLHGWSRIMSHVFDFDLTPDLFAAMREAAESAR
ncbi:MAG: shikimate dehydrogenase [Bryobacteraceae bacterium]